MEPCQFRQGNSRQGRAGNVGILASMEPCQFRQGNLAVNMFLSRIIVRLQWSPANLGRETVHMVVDRWKVIHVETASMEPCQFRQGNTTNR